MESNQGLKAAFALSFIGGIIVFVTGIVGLVWFGSGGPGWMGFGSWMGRMMQGYHGFGGGGQYGFFSVVSILGLISGVAILTGAIMLRSRPQDSIIWGVLVLVFAIVSIADMGGYFVGAILGIVGGALALGHHAPAAQQAPQKPPQ